MLYTPEFELTSVHRLTEWHSPCRFFFVMQIFFIIPLLNFIQLVTIRISIAQSI